jgi:hypothetical protein
MQLPVKATKLAVEIPAEVAAMFPLAANMEGVIPRLPQIKIIHAGQLFHMPDESKPETFEGVIIDKHPTNAWWEKEKSESGVTVPDCYSMDGLAPEDDSANKQNDICGQPNMPNCCPRNEYKTDPKGGGGKACKNMRRVHVIIENSILPRRLSIGPTSLRDFDDYMTSLYDSGLPYACIVTEFKLEAKEADGNVWSVVKPTRGRVLAGEELISVANYIKKYKEGARAQDIQSDEYFDETVEENGYETDKPDIPF